MFDVPTTNTLTTSMKTSADSTNTIPANMITTTTSIKTTNTMSTNMTATTTSTKTTTTTDLTDGTDSTIRLSSTTSTKTTATTDLTDGTDSTIRLSSTTDNETSILIFKTSVFPIINTNFDNEGKTNLYVVIIIFCLLIVFCVCLLIYRILNNRITYTPLIVNELEMEEIG